jgi:hypothetical protein
VYQIDYTRGIIKITQNEQALKLLRSQNMHKAKPTASPMGGPAIPTIADIPTDAAILKIVMDSCCLPAILGGMNYLQCGTMPGLTVALKILSKFPRAYGEKHIAFAMYILRYIVGQLGTGLTFRAGFAPVTQVFTDASHACCPDSLRSLSSVVIKYGGNTVYWKAIWQRIISHSSTESELMALDLGATLGQFIKHLTIGMGGKVTSPIPVFVDNQASIDLSSNPVASGRNVHMHARYFYMRYMVEEKEYRLIQMPTNEQIADVLCTFKGGATFARLIARILGCAIVTIDDSDKDRPLARWDDSHLS